MFVFVKEKKQERFVENVNPPTDGDLNRGFYMEIRFKRIFCFKYVSMYCRNKEKIDDYRQV
jgi:hypothetical protein